jgi:hypothetical protein
MLSRTSAWRERVEDAGGGRLNLTRGCILNNHLLPRAPMCYRFEY